MMDRIEFEEWALKAIDPALSPRLLPSPSSKAAAAADPSTASPASSSSAPAAPLHAVATTKGRQPREGVELLYPASLLPDEKALLDALKHQLDHREPHHRSLMYRCLVCVFHP